MTTETEIVHGISNISEEMLIGRVVSSIRGSVDRDKYCLLACLNRDTDGSVDIIFNFGWTGSPVLANFVSDRAKGSRHGNRGGSGSSAEQNLAYGL